MRIRCFTKNVELTEVKYYELKNCEVVIDGQNFLYNIYESTGLPFEFGCDSDKYAEILRERLSVFKKANVKCYFLFKGGKSDNDSKDSKLKAQNEERIQSMNSDTSSKKFVIPIFCKEIHQQVLDEMNFNYVVCQFECKKQCIALAQKLNCPIISYDIEFCFSGVPYIHNSNDVLLNVEITRGIPCNLFLYEDFVKKYNIDKEKLATFVVLTDEFIFPEGHFKKFFDLINIRYSPYRRNILLLKWLAKRSHRTIEIVLKKCFRSDEIDAYTRERNKMIEFICRKQEAGVPVGYLMNGNCVEFTENDQIWFEKGVACGYVPLQYVNVYHWNIIDGSWCIEDMDAEDAMFLTVDVIKYAFNLLTNFERSEFKFHKKSGEVITVVNTNETLIPKPTYTAMQSPFENGWDQIKSLRLFEHFLANSMPTLDISKLISVPEDARMLLIALVYFSLQKSVDMNVEICSVLLSYVMLAKVKPTCDKSNHNINETFLDDDQVTDNDCNIANEKMSEYFKVTDSERRQFSKIVLHPLVEFQHCLQQLNFLNTLCGSPYKPTMYSRTYNSTFVYRIAHRIKYEYSNAAADFVNKELSCSVTVLGFFNRLKNAYEEIMYH